MSEINDSTAELETVKKTSYNHLHHLNLHEMDPGVSNSVEFHIDESFIHFVWQALPI